VVVVLVASVNPPLKAKMVSQSSMIVVWAKFRDIAVLIPASVKPSYQLTRELFWQTTIKVKSGIRLRERVAKNGGIICRFKIGVQIYPSKIRVYPLLMMFEFDGVD
jgi:hypothetical protein